jgi:single-strand DNA-binding protein
VNNPSIVFTGNVGAKPELRQVQGPSGPSVVANVRVAVTPRKRAAGSDEWVDDGETMWFSVSAWRGLAANCVASLNAGDRVLVRGRLSARTWTDENGVERSAFNVEAEDVALDLARTAAMVVRSGVPRQPGAGAADEPAPGGVDLATGEVRDGEPVAV